VTQPVATPVKLPPLGRDPLVSIVVTAYNYDQFIGEALDSVLGQTYSNLEIVVADDGSSDDTASIVRRYEASDSRVRLVTGKNLGQPGNTNRGFHATTGDIIAFLDADDRFSPGKVESVVRAFLAHPDHGLCLHPLQPVDQAGTPFGSSFPKNIDAGWVHEHLLANAGRCSFPATSAISIRRGVAEMVFPIRSTSRRVGDAFIHFPAAYLTNVCALSETLAEYRCHEGSMTRKADSKARQVAALITEYEEVFSINLRFVQDHFGNAVATRLKLTDSQDYLELVLRYLALTGRGKHKGLSARGCVREMSAGPRRSAWRMLVRLPQPLLRNGMMFGGLVHRSCKYARLKTVTGIRRHLVGSRTLPI
jgi:glycosyltransferase involved in cell wall biosynthesis